MNTSESIVKISEALSLAQAEMTGAKKDSKNPFFKSSYSDLTSVMNAISRPFANNGLAFVQSPSFAGGLVTVTTRLLHKSGEWIEGMVCLPATKNDAQGYGSAITYGKRYGLQAMAGVPSIDDDGQDAVKFKADAITLDQSTVIYDKLKESNSDVKAFCKRLKINSVVEMPPSMYDSSLALIEKKMHQRSLEAHISHGGVE